ncbi:hypothetical protein M413DRAFT_119469 [Hebeloma cylindrosporum]|uniref:Uncharacterized protein n=1 Tax=Hebeloma cylindrosporum TaxID=76867 RepID=A0A0C3D1D6_HEBCY|nr:hypothetical protein M413DRAFT_119469 [Hebeloma cylindrosporum h7]
MQHRCSWSGARIWSLYGQCRRFWEPGSPRTGSGRSLHGASSCSLSHCRENFIEISHIVEPLRSKRFRLRRSWRVQTICVTGIQGTLQSTYAGHNRRRRSIRRRITACWGLPAVYRDGSLFVIFISFLDWEQRLTFSSRRPHKHC